VRQERVVLIAILIVIAIEGVPGGRSMTTTMTRAMTRR
jgi:hypothetical protein